MSLHASRAVRPLEDRAGRSIGWWGAVLGLLVVVHLMAALFVSAVYLRAAGPTWPPDASTPPRLLLGLVAVGVLVLAALAASAAAGAMARGARATFVLLLAGVVLALLAGALRGATTVVSDDPISQHAYWSMRWMLGVADTTLAVTLALILLVTAVHTARGRIQPGHHAELGVVALWAWVTAALGVVSWVVFAGVTVWWGGV